MDDLRIYNYALSGSDIKSLYGMGSVAPPPTPTWCDYFDSTTLARQWSWVRGDPTHWSLTDRPGYLRITIQHGDLYGRWNDNENMLLRTAPTGDFEVVTCVTINPTLNYQQAGLVVYQDDDNHFRLTRAYHNGGIVQFLKEVGASATSDQVDCNLTTTYLKVVKQGSTYTGYWSADGSNWRQVNQYTDVHFTNLKVGLAAFHAAGNAQIPADFDFICVGPVGTVTIPSQTPTTTPIPTGTVLIADSRTVSPGGTVTVPIRLDKAQNIGSMNFILTYDPNVLKVTRVDKGSLLANIAFAPNYKQPPVIRFGFAAKDGVSGSGPMAYVEFEAIGSGGSSSPLTLSEILAKNTSEQTLSLTAQNGKVTIEKKTLKGDYNGDGKVTELDALAALRMSVKLLAEDLILDMDNDGKVTAEDARLILKQAVTGR
jgi:regulation of enolase protein 1 (concanavalin A-like superfamily)